jgi:hypothetical protein
VAAIMLAAQTATRVNGVGKEITQATYLLEEIREWTLKLPFSDPNAGDAHNPPGPDGSDPQVFVDDLDDLMDVTYSPPRDGVGSRITSMAGWSQQIQLQWKSPTDLAATLSPGTSDIIRVNVTVLRGNRPVLSAGWLATRRSLK